MSVDGVLAEFCAAGLWPGVGSALTADLAAAGIGTAADVTEERLRTVVTAKRAATLFTAWIGASHRFDTAQVLVRHGLPIRWTFRLIDSLGDAAAEALVADPWQLLSIAEARVEQADALARALQPTVTAADPRRGRALVLRATTLEARNGHTVTPVDMIRPGLRRDGLDADAAIRAAQDADLVRVVNGQVSPTPLAAAEERIADDMARLADAARRLGNAGDIDAVTSGLDGAQRAAVRSLAEHGVSILTGGPGTGKSRTVAAVVALCERLGVEFALAAPTGRAAKRLTELASGQDGSGEATTIHRLLGARPLDSAGRTRFDSDEDNPLDVRVVVIDETSMVDVELAAALTRAIPSGAHLLWVGDPAQLPSIGPGRVMGDLLSSDSIPTIELTTLYRQAEGGAIARLAAEVRGGRLPVPDREDREVVIIPANDSARAAHRVVQLVTDSIPRVFGLSADQIQVVTPIHRGPAGTEQLNRVLKEAINPGPHPGSRTVRGFDPGDRVVATANYLDAQPFGYANGEIGTVVDTEGRSVLVAFPGGDAEVSGKALTDLRHGWAVTVHRAQGSEWEAVVVVLPPEAGRMLSRPLVYTALTRARRHLSVVHAAGPAVSRAVRTIGSRPRRTRLGALAEHGAAARPAAGLVGGGAGAS